MTNLITRALIFSVAAFTAALTVTVVMLISSKPAGATQTTPPPYSHSWYVYNTDGAYWYSKAQNVDGPFDNSRCTNSLVILDFGQPDYQNGTYGTNYFAPGYPFVPDLVIIYDLEDYAQGWYFSTGNCPRLHLVAGTNNTHEVPSGLGTPAGAGSAWAASALAVENYVVTQGYSSQITAWAGSDMEQPGSGEAWDCAGPTRSFVDGYNGYPNKTVLLDYGTAWVPNTCWTAADVAHVAFTGADYPLPEIYSASALGSWISVRQSYYMAFKGVLTECQQADPLPTDYCTQGQASGQYAPNLAWSAFWYNLVADGLSSGTSLDYAANIPHGFQ